MLCDSEYLFPMKADIFYSLIKQNEYGQPNKEWVFDRCVDVNLTPAGGAGTEDIKPQVFLQNENKLVGRSKSDLRISSKQDKNAVTNIILTNIRNADNSLIYKETSGPRSGRGTIYEVGTIDPFVSPFGSIEYYKLVLRRSENQTSGD